MHSKSVCPVPGSHFCQTKLEHPPHLLQKFVFWLENKGRQGARMATLVTVIHAGAGRWCKRSLNVNAAVIRVVLIPLAWRLSMHQSQPCVSRGEPTGINLEPEVKVWLFYPHGHKTDHHRVHSQKHKLGPKLKRAGKTNQRSKMLKRGACFDNLVTGKSQCSSLHKWLRASCIIMIGYLRVLFWLFPFSKWFIYW